MKRLIVSLLIVLVVLTGSGVVFAHERVVTQAMVPAFAAPACTETGLTGSALQENKLFCSFSTTLVNNSATCVTNMGDGGIVYTAAIGAANRHIMVGTPTQCNPSNDWSGLPISYVEFSNGNFHAEFHGDNVVRIYDTSGGSNRQVYP